MSILRTAFVSGTFCSAAELQVSQCLRDIGWEAERAHPIAASALLATQ